MSQDFILCPIDEMLWCEFKREQSIASLQTCGDSFQDVCHTVALTPYGMPHTSESHFRVCHCKAVQTRRYFPFSLYKILIFYDYMKTADFMMSILGKPVLNILCKGTPRNIGLEKDITVDSVDMGKLLSAINCLHQKRW